MSTGAPSTSQPPTFWLCCQIGAREHYAVARGLKSFGQLAGLLTDAWVPPGSVWGLLPGSRLRRLRERYSPELASARVQAFTGSLLALELRNCVRRHSDHWPSILQRNEWFQDRVLGLVEKAGGFGRMTGSGRAGTLFAYSYAARRVFSEAKRAGWTTVLGQIDPGPIEEEIVTRHQERIPDLRTSSRPAPIEYWRRWREECSLADHIVVNSQWSAHLLDRAGIEMNKVHVVPLAYEPQAQFTSMRRSYPPAFTRTRPLRILFLGSAVVRKGVAEMLAASRLLAAEPIDFHIVGPVGIEIPEGDLDNPRLHWHGPVPRSAAEAHYRAADVFLFPTLSDGFGLTQLEARACGLPVIASRHCGDVVVDGVSGIVLSEVSADAIASALARCLNHPEELSRMSAAASAPDERFTLKSITTQLVALTQAER